MSGALGSVAHRQRRRMKTTVLVSRGEPTRTFDPDTGTYTNVPGPTVWTGKAHVRPTDLVARVVESAGAAVSLRTYDVVIPAGIGGPQVNDYVKVTASTDASLMGRNLRLLDTPGDDRQGNRHLVAVEATA